MAKALVGSDAVISTLGSMKAKDELLTRASAALVTAATAAGVKRVVIMSTFVAAPQFKRDLMGKLMASMMKSVVADKSQGETHLQASNLDWTLSTRRAWTRLPPGSQSASSAPTSRSRRKTGSPAPTSPPSCSPRPPATPTSASASSSPRSSSTHTSPPRLPVEDPPP